MYSKSRDPALRELMSTSADAEKLRQSHDAQRRTIDAVLGFLTHSDIPHEYHHRSELKDIPDFHRYSLVITVGGDGTFLEASHYVHGIPMLGVNSDPASSVGYFSAANAQTFADCIRTIGDMPRTTLARMAIERNGQRIPEYVLNDVLLANENPADTTRFYLHGEKKKRGNSGLIVCTPAGSTGWMKNVGGIVMPLDAQELQYRERDAPAPAWGFAKQLEAYSLTRPGKMYVDGAHLVYPFTLYDTIRFSLGEPLTVLGDLNQKRK